MYLARKIVVTARTAYRVAAFLLGKTQRLFAIGTGTVNIGLSVSKFPFLQVEKAPHLSDDTEKPLVFSAPVVYLPGHTAVNAPHHYSKRDKIE